MRWIVCGMAAILAAAPVWGWSSKEHAQIARIAAEELLADPTTSTEIKAWLKEAAVGATDAAGEKEFFLHARVGMMVRGVDGLAFWATVPDTLMGMSGDLGKQAGPFGVPERVRHVLALEDFMPNAEDHGYKPDLSHRPKLEDIPHDLTDARFQKAGMLPFGAEDAYRRMVADIRQGRLNDKPGQYPRDEHAAKWAGYLAHYVADSTQPHHGTNDYMSQSYFPDRPWPKIPSLHKELEYRMCDDDSNDFPKLREEYWAAFTLALSEAKDSVQTSDVWRGTVEVMMRSYDALPLIGQAAAKTARPDAPAIDTEAFFRFRGEYLGRTMSVMEMKAHQQAWAIKRVERLWLQAWAEAHRQG